MQTIIVIPCYNEEKRLRSHDFLDFVQVHPDVTFLFVNDGSKDNTLVMLQNLSRQSAKLMLLNLPKNAGKAEAVRQGVMYILQKWQPHRIGFWDADLSTPLNEIECFIQQMEKYGCSMVIGTRIKRLGAKVYRKTTRFLLGRMFATVAAYMMNLPVYDTQCGAKLFKTQLAASLFQLPFISKWLFDVELLARYIQLSGIPTVCRQVYEYPVYEWQDIGGSKLKLVDFLSAPMELWKIWRTYIKK
ncbi:MAG: glycosyltransferase [Prevotellaceae bacterium]|jgi:glycosyltransferase involved in cell wall biosynthesis|nr:glycosyltransferase [Prevotellaceae bacterium]